ncbi:Ldh family oxidoreductase [uncultured Oscillibacter sp.]|uniref:Ldh family oxidoreductase n=1 Tax=uncultured Oscillibacter sp. TaxID=876091 RepID=UPI0025EAA779|nr:Ldh family oxidoreductase [uncultured Oscillibacter sp.]
MDRIAELPIAEVKEKSLAILMGVGVPDADAAKTVDALLDAELCGVESHGLMRLNAYVERLNAGTIAPAPEIQITVRDAVAQIDGGNGLGQVVMTKAVDTCGALAKSFGVGIASVCRSNHFGTAAYYARSLARQGCVGFVASAAGPTMAPFGGMDLLLGTNPFAVAFPGREMTFCADMATSAAAKGKIRIYTQKGEEIPLGWALDEDGHDTTDSQAAIRGILLPMAGHKGYALAMVVDMLCALLSGAALSGESSSMFRSDCPSGTGHFAAALDIAHFLPPDEFADRAQEWFDALRSSRKRPGVPRIYIPGEPEAQRLAASGETICILRQTMESLEQNYQKYGA